jgi:hypothetical protein
MALSHAFGGNMEEVWKTIPDYQDYEGSNFGNVRSTKRGKVRQLNPWKHKKGYMSVDLNDGARRKTVMVHRVIAELFIENPHKCPQVNHKDGDKTNNCVVNLEWVSINENMERGKELAGSALTEEHILKIYVLGINGTLKSEEIGVEFNIDAGLVDDIKAGKVFSKITHHNDKELALKAVMDQYKVTIAPVEEWL